MYTVAVVLKVYADLCFESRIPLTVDRSLSAKKQNAISGGGKNFRYRRSTIKYSHVNEKLDFGVFLRYWQRSFYTESKSRVCHEQGCTNHLGQVAVAEEFLYGGD